MMKMLMRVSKTQVPATVKNTTGGTRAFNTGVAIAAGYKNIDVFVVGGSGGPGGDAKLNTGNISFGAGGGGGGSIRKKAALKDLPVPCLMTVGLAGSGGADTSESNVAASYGYEGNASSFGAWSAYGGDGGEGGLAKTEGTDIFRATVGGNGGGNSLGLGVAGQGGHVTDFYEARGPAINPTDGTFVVTSTPPEYSGAGRGGGGGGGAIKVGGSIVRVSQDGADGANSIFVAPGEVTGNTGGGGGGADVYAVSAPLVFPESHDYYGGGELSDPNGVVVYALS